METTYPLSLPICEFQSRSISGASQPKIKTPSCERLRYQNIYFPFYASAEFSLPWAWLFEYAMVLPLMHYVWVRANQPCRSAASGWMVMTLGLCILAWVFDRLGVHHWETPFLLLFAGLHIPAAFLLVIGCWRLHRTLEVRS